MDLGAVVAWFADPTHWTGSNGIPVRVLEHVLVSGLAIAIGAAIALPVGLAIGHTGRGERLAVAAAGLGRAVPSYALLILFVPLFGLGFASAVPALVLLSIPPILVNAVVGLRDVDAETVEAGRGMGMTEWQVLRDVELPAALPAIAAGLRTSAVQVVATATLAALVAGGGLGRYIVDGFAVQRYDRLVAGAILVALLAFLTERAFTLAQGRLERRAGRSASDIFGPMGPAAPFAS
ncbi:MAG TPA: ABC transporter permease [Candidatus Limnocylindrales bacterium]|nr:ABC transporter permease [Candidatus Limnocylindrales bacterium]